MACFFSVLATVNSSNFTAAVKPLGAEFKKSSTGIGYFGVLQRTILRSRKFGMGSDSESNRKAASVSSRTSCTCCMQHL